MNNMPLGPKDPAEVKILKFPFEHELNGASIALVDVTAVSTYQGTDVDPGSTRLGTAVVSGTDVLVRMQGGLDGVAYKWRVGVLDSNGNKHVLTDWVQVATL